MNNNFSVTYIVWSGVGSRVVFGSTTLGLFGCHRYTNSVSKGDAMECQENERRPTVKTEKANGRRPRNGEHPRQMANDNENCFGKYCINGNGK